MTVAPRGFEGRIFDPALDGFGFRNPVGSVARGAAGGALFRRFGDLLYGRGLCFGMVAAALRNFADDPAARAPLAGLPPSPEVLGVLRAYQARQYRPRAVWAAVRGWFLSRGGRPEGVVGRLRLPGSSADPHVLCFGPATNRGFLSCLARAHAVAPYRIEEGDGEARVYVYDPNHPGDGERCVTFRRDTAGRYAGFAYKGFRSREGWGITLLPLRVVGDTVRLPRGEVPYGGRREG